MTRQHPLRGRIPAWRGPCSTLRVATIRYGDYVEQPALTPALSQRERGKWGEMVDERSRPPYLSPNGGNQKSPVLAGYDWLPSPRPSPRGRGGFSFDGDELFDHYRHTPEELGKQKGFQ